MDPEVKREIKREIERQLNIITSGEAGATTSTTEDITNWYPNMPTLPARPIMFPYGYFSRAPVGTLSVVGQQGSHPGNKLTLGHRDSAPPFHGIGESSHYSFGGYEVWMANTDIWIGKGGTYEHMVVGESLVALLTAVLNAIVSHTHEGNLGVATSPPLNASAFTALIGQYLSNNYILASDEGRFAE